MAEVRPIDANALLGLYKKWLPQLAADEDAGDRNGVETCIAVLEDEPTLDYAPVRHGHWIHCAGKSNLWYCSECGGKILYNPTRRTYNIEKLPVDEMNRFCRSCGAKMDGGQPNA